MYCVECGKEGKLYEHICGKCFVKKTIFFGIPKVVKVIICNHCFSRAKGNHWEEASSDEVAIKNELIDNVKLHAGVKHPHFSIELEPFKTNTLKANITIDAKYDDLNISDKINTEVRINYSTCNRCSRRSGNYYEAIIQIRGTKRSLDEDEMTNSEEIVNSQLNSFVKSEYNAFLTKIEYIHGGIDFYLGSSSIARQISKQLAKKFVGKIKESSTLVGRKDGKDVYRVTFNVRIPEYKKGDFVFLNDRIYQISNLLHNQVLCLDIINGQKQRFNLVDFASYKLLGGSELIFDAVVVFENPKEVQILDPVNYKTIELIKPPNFQVQGETVKIFKNQNEIFLLPNIL